MLRVFILIVIGITVIRCNKVSQENPPKKTTSLSDKNDALQKRLKSLNELITQNPQDASLIAERANIYYLLGDSAHCFMDIQNAIRLKPNDADFLYLKGFYAYNYDQIDTALTYLKKSYHVLNQNPDVMFYIGNCYFLKQNHQEAQKWYLKAIEKDENPNYYHALALNSYKQKKFQETEKYLQSALQKDSLHGKSLSLYAELYIYDYKNFSKAYTIIQKLLKQEQLPVGNYLEGSLYFQKALLVSDSVEKEGLLRLAIDCYSHAIKKDPYYTNVFYDRGYAFFLLKRYDLASKSFEEVLKQNPKDYRAAFMLGSIAEYYEDKKLALQYYELALKINPNFMDAKKALEELQ